MISLNGLGNIDYLSLDSIILRNNQILSFCNIQPICDFIANGGPATVSNNASRCTNIPEIETACQPVSVEETISKMLEVQVFPNPITDIIQVQGDGI